MNNISFDRPWMLIIGLLGIILVIVGFVLAVNKDNRNKRNIISFIIHLVMTVLMTLSLAGTRFEKVITETNIYVLADVSYSSSRNLDLIDEYIESLKENAPKNSKLGVVCFGNDYELLVKPGKRLKSVKESKVDNSQTNIAKALEYTSTLFKDNVIKRIVIISDGEETSKSNIVTLVQNLSLENIYVDAIYLDNNLQENDYEAQITGVDYVDSTYLDTKEDVYVFIDSNNENRGYLDLYHNGELLESKPVSLKKGNNSEIFNLLTDVEGIHRYELKLRLDQDITEQNNLYQFNQEVVDKINMMVVTKSEEDRAKIEELYADSAEIDYYINTKDVPFTVEELSKYDEFIISNTDISTLNNSTKFIDSLDILVSEFGKSLTTFGNTYIQSDYDDETLSALSDMLPVKYGTGENDEKLLTMVIDISRSMEQASKFIIAKQTAGVILDKLSDNIKVMVYVFYGKNYMAIEPTEASNRESIKKQINNLEAYQGTMISGALNSVYQKIINLAYSKNEVILISDGEAYDDPSEKTAILNYANKLAKKDVRISTIQVVSQQVNAMNIMTSIKDIGHGNYYHIKDEIAVKNLVLKEVMDYLNDVVLEDNPSSVQINLYKNDLVEGINALPDVLGLYNNQNKASSTVVMNALYKDKNDYEYEIPLYTYWKYGNGLVSSYSSSLTGNWSQNWDQDASAKRLYQNALIFNRPIKSIDSAFIISHTPSSVSTEIKVLAPSIHKDSKLELHITYPDNSQSIQMLSFDGEYYVTNVYSSQVGEYKLELIYELGNVYKTEYLYNVSYLPEYNSFNIYEASNLHYMVSSNGQVSEDGNLILENNESIVRKYILDFAPTCMILCAILFIVDIIIRKLTIEDLKSLIRFNRKKLNQERGKINEK